MKKKFMLLVLSVLSVLAAAIALVACGGSVGYTGPENIAYDGQYITWDKVSAPIVGDVLGKTADYYTVSVNGGEKQRSNSTTYAYTSSETFEVTIAAVFDGEEKTSASVTFKPLAPIEEVSVSDDGAVFWNAVSGATAYSLTVNGQAVTTTDTRYELPAGSNRVKVKPIVSGDPTYYSSWSNEVSATVYNTPTNIKYDGTTLSWMGNASEYLVTVSGGASMQKTVRGNSCQFISDNKDFTVEVKAIGNHTSTYDSKSATEEYHYLDPVTDLTVEDGILKWTAIANAEGFKIKINNVEKGTVTEPEYDKIVAGESQDVCVMPVNNSGNYFSSWSGVKTVQILEAPVLQWNDSLELDGEANMNLHWQGFASASGYTVRLTKDGVEIEKTFITANMYGYDYLNVGVYTVEVKSVADGKANLYDSKYSAPITVERLAAPKGAGNNFITSDADHLSAGFTVNFTKVAGANSYQLYEDGAPMDGKRTTGLSFTAEVPNNSEIVQKTHQYYVRSIGECKGNYITLSCLTEQALYFDITVQATPQNLEMAGKMLSWDPVVGNNGYTVSYGSEDSDGGKTFTASTEQYDLSVLHDGTYTVSVCTRGNGETILASNFSDPVRITRLKAPTNIRITSEGDGTIECDPVPDATGGYRVYFGDAKIPLKENSMNQMYQYIGTEATTVYMTAEANEWRTDGSDMRYYMSSDYSKEQQFVRLAAPVFPERAVSDSTNLVWNAPKNINTGKWNPTYRLYSDHAGSEVISADITGTSYDISDLDEGKYTFYVKAIGNGTTEKGAVYLDSDYSAVKDIRKLTTPEITVKNGAYTWKGDEYATSYSIKIDGVIVKNVPQVSGCTEYSYVPSFLEEKNYTVTLQAIGDGQDNINSKIFERIQQTKRLQSPEISCEYSHKAVTEGGSINVTITTPSPNAKEYEYEIAGVPEASPEKSYKKVIESAGKYMIRVKALGGTFDENETYYVDSLYTRGEEIVLLGAPSQSSFAVTPGGSIHWNAVSGAYGYDYQISYNGGDSGEEIKHTPNSEILAPIEDFKTYHSITIRVRATGGNDGKTVSSKWIEFTWTNSSL